MHNMEKVVKKKCTAFFRLIHKNVLARLIERLSTVKICNRLWAFPPAFAVGRYVHTSAVAPFWKCKHFQNAFGGVPIANAFLNFTEQKI